MLDSNYSCKAHRFIPNQKFHFLLGRKQMGFQVFNQEYELETLRRCLNRCHLRWTYHRENWNSHSFWLIQLRHSAVEWPLPFCICVLLSTFYFCPLCLQQNLNLSSQYISQVLILPRFCYFVFTHLNAKRIQAHISHKDLYYHYDFSWQTIQNTCKQFYL